MKLVCAWCQKVIRDGPEEPVSHGICPECARRTTHRLGAPLYSPDPGHFWTKHAMGSFLLIFLAGLLWLLAALFSEGLHFVSSGKIPRFISWDLPAPPPPPPPKSARHRSP